MNKNIDILFSIHDVPLEQPSPGTFKVIKLATNPLYSLNIMSRKKTEIS